MHITMSLIPQPGDPVYAGQLRFNRMHSQALLYRLINVDGSSHMERFNSAVEAQNFADVNNLEYFGLNDEQQFVADEIARGAAPALATSQTIRELMGDA